MFYPDILDNFPRPVNTSHLLTAKFYSSKFSRSNQMLLNVSLASTKTFVENVKNNPSTSDGPLNNRLFS